MLRINFADLIGRHSKDKRALMAIEEWLNRHQDATVLYPSVLARETSLDPVSLAKALRILVKEGILRQVYKVTTPDGVLADREFSDLKEIPEELEDRFNRSFATAESDVVPVFQMVA
jgi:hypothetical protein